MVSRWRKVCLFTGRVSSKRSTFYRGLHVRDPGVEQAKNGRGPLSGIRVLDLTRVLAGPFASMILADLGAEVIKIEKPGTGDDTRSWGPPFVGSESTYFLSVNRNKKSIAVNIKDPKGLQLVQKLARKSDVVLENYLPGKLDKLGLGYTSLSKQNPSLIYCSITGYGPGGPYDQRPGYDVIVSAIGGLMSITGPEDGEPCKSGVAVTDLITGLYAHGAVMAALIDRQKTGKGQKIDCSLLASQVAVLSHVATSFLNTGFKTGRYGTAHHSIVPYQAFKTTDGHVLVGAGNDGLIGGLMSITGPEDGEPCKSGVAVTDLITGLYAHGAVMAALIDRQKTGKGQKIDCSLLASQVAVLSHVATSFLNTGFKTGRYGTAHHSIVPYQAFKTTDGHVLVGAGNDGLFKKLCKVLEIRHLADDPAYQTNDKRVENRKELLKIISHQFSKKTTKEWLHLLEDSGIPYGPINDVEQVLDDAQVKYKNMVQEVHHPTIGQLKVPGPAVEYNGRTALVPALSPPLLGQHTKEVLRDVLGYDDSQIKTLHDMGSVATCDEQPNK